MNSYRSVLRVLVVVVITCTWNVGADEKFHRYERPNPGVYVVEVENKDAAHIKALAKALAKSHGGRLITTYTEVLGGFAVEMSESRARALSHVPGITGVHESAQDKLQYVPESPVARSEPAASWGLDRIDNNIVQYPLSPDGFEDYIDGTYRYYYTGIGVYVYFLDTGATVIGDLANRISPSDKYSFIGVTGSQPKSDITGDCEGGPGHGTSVASTIGGASYGVARNVRLVSVKVSSSCGSGGGFERLIQALEWIKLRHDGGELAPAVVNISLEYDENPAIDAAVRDAIAAGVTVVVGAGNDGLDACDYSPARTGKASMIANNPGGFNAITVAASDRNDNVSNWGDLQSNTGQCVDIFAPGSDLTAQGKQGPISYWAGTSAASPHVAGIAALTIARYGAISPTMVEAEILQAATAGVINNSQSGAQMLLGTTDDLVTQVRPPRRRACCS